MAKTILIVDDDPDVCELLAMTLKPLGYPVEIAKNAEEAAQKCRQLLPAVMISDLMLAPRSGFELVRELQDGPTAKIPIIIITAYYTETSTAKMLKEEPNVVDVLEKPVDSALLHALLKKLLK
jgi:CheY-like chemotaxis protein